MFAIKNRMTKIPANFGNKEAKCLCGDIETMLHIYNCESLNQNKTQIPYNEIFNGNLESQIEIFRRMETNLEKRN